MHNCTPHLKTQLYSVTVLEFDFADKRNLEHTGEGIVIKIDIKLCILAEHCNVDDCLEVIVTYINGFDCVLGDIHA